MNMTRAQGEQFFAEETTPPTSPSVDVIIPAYNAARFIKETIASVLAQTYLPRKIIVVDDGSTDETRAVVEGLKSDLIELIATPHVGVSHARNTGIRAAKADYIAFLDSDDLWLAEKLAFQIEKLQANPQAKVCYSEASYINAAGNEAPLLFPIPACGCGDVFAKVMSCFFAISGSASSVLAERKLVLTTSLFDEKLAYLEDLDFWARLALITEFEYVPLPHVKIRSHSYSTTRMEKKRHSEEIIEDSMFSIPYVFERYAADHAYSERTINRLYADLFYKCLLYRAIGRLPAFLQRLEAETPALYKQMQARFSLRLSVALLFAYYLRIPARLRLFFHTGSIFLGGKRAAAYFRACRA